MRQLGYLAALAALRMTVWFDTGAPRSYLSLQAAERAGITPDSAGATFLGLSGGLGPGSNKVWSAPVDTFQLGGEKVQHTHLLISNLDPAHQIGQVGDDMPDDIDARLARAGLLQSHPDTDPTAAADIKSDLDTVSRLSSPAAPVRMALAQQYSAAGDYPAAMDQLTQWLSHHRVPGDQITGLNERCWLRATSNRDLRQGLDDCNEALNLGTDSAEQFGTLIRASADDPEVLDSRALVYLRLGNLDDAIHDYDSALHTDPSIPTSLYGRGLAELRLGEKAQGQADLTAAKKLDSGVAKRFADMGLTP